MQGRIKGLATAISKDEPRAIPVHRLPHCPYRTSGANKPVRDALRHMKEILQLVKQSPKREPLFTSLKDNSTSSLRPLCPTRWRVRATSIDSVLSNYSVQMDTMAEIHSTTNDEYSHGSGGQLAMMETFSTFLGLKLAECNTWSTMGYNEMDLTLGEQQQRLSTSKFSVGVDLEKILGFDKLKFQLRMLPTVCQVGTSTGPMEAATSTSFSTLHRVRPI